MMRYPVSTALITLLTLTEATSVFAANDPPAAAPPVATNSTPAPSATSPVAAAHTAPQVELPYKLLTQPAPMVPAPAGNISPAAPAPTATEAKAPEPKPAPNWAALSPSTASPAAAPPSPTPPAPAPIAAATPPVPAKPQITLSIDIDLSRQRMTLTEFGKQASSWPISSGREGYRSPTGTFRPLWASKMWFSNKYDNAPMPNAVFFSGGVAMHATQATGMLGHPASHGCIRQSPANAATTYKLVAKHGHEHTRIVVHGVPHDDEPRVAQRDRPSNYARIGARDSHMRRVILVDGSGNRRIAEIPANDPRLLAYQRNQITRPLPQYYTRSAW